MTALDGPATLMLRSFLHKEQLDESSRFAKFKSIFSNKIQGAGINLWCLNNGVDITIFSNKIQGMNSLRLNNGVEIIPEMDEVSPMEAFFVGYRTWERILGEKGEGRVHVLKVLSRAGLEMDERVVDLLVRIGDRVPVSDNEDFVYVFPRDLYEKILVFGTLPES